MVTEKQLGQFEHALRRGRYLFHVHTDWTDGKSSLADYCAAAREHGFQSVIIAEHIRRQCTYDFRAFLQLVEEERLACAMEIVVGVEAKVLPGGSLDISDEILTEIQVLAIAEHSFRGDAYTLAQSLIQVFKSFRNAQLARIWVHPGLKLLQQQPASAHFFQEALQLALEHEVYIEFNLRHKLPPEPFLSLIPPSRVVIGLDAHSVAEVELLGKVALDMESKLVSADWTTNKRWIHENH